MGPGPSNPYPEAIEAFTRPVLGHLGGDFLDLLDETCERLRSVFRTANALTFPVSGTGSAGMEAAFVNVVSEGDAVVVGVNGVFGERMCDVAARCGARVVRVDAEWGSPLDPQRVLDAHPAPAVIAVVHAETSTGVRNDLAELGAAKGDALLLADCAHRSAASMCASTNGAWTSPTAELRSASGFRPDWPPSASHPALWSGCTAGPGPGTSTWA